MARCGCGGAECGCNLIAGDNVTVGGSGSAANPWVINSITNCAEVRTCLTGGDGLNYDNTTGDFDLCLSPAANNAAIIDASGCLFVQTGAATVTAGCGLTGTGAPGSPLAANVQAWPYPCPPETSGGVIACDADGELKGEPAYKFYYEQLSETRTYPNLVVPTGFDVTLDSFTFTWTNPDPCRSVITILEREVDVDFDFPPGAGASSGHGTDEMTYFRNTGTTTINDQHTQTTKVFRQTAVIPPGGTDTSTLAVTSGRGTAGATYNRIQVFIRAMMYTL